MEDGYPRARAVEPHRLGEQLCVSTAISGRRTALRIGLYGNIASVTDDTPHEWKVICLDKRDGTIAWEQTANKGVPKVKRHTKSTHANSTLATDGTHLAAFFGSEGLHVYDLKGKLLWRKILACSTPASSGFLTLSGIRGAHRLFTTAVSHRRRRAEGLFPRLVRREDRQGIWRTPRADVPTWGSPAVIDVDGRSQVVVNGWRHIGGYDLQTGKEIWKLSATGDIPVPTPVFGHGLIFLTSAHGPGSPVYAIKPTATGDITLAADATSNDPSRGAFRATAPTWRRRSSTAITCMSCGPRGF